MGQANLALLAASLITRASAFGFATARSAWVFRTLAPLPPRVHLEALFLGFIANTFLPLRAGMVLRVAHLSKASSQPLETVVGAVTAERLVDIACLLALALAMLPTLTSLGATPTAVGAAALFLGLSMVILVAAAPHAESLSKHLPPSPAARFLGLFHGLRAIRSARSIGVAAALTVGFWACQGASFLLWLAAFGLPHPPWAAGAFLVMVAFGGIIPSGPAFAGPWHYFAALTAEWVGADRATAAGFAIVAHFVSFVPLALLALGWLWSRFFALLREDPGND